MVELPDADELTAAFRARTLPKAAWTHEAHLLVCLTTLRQYDHDVDAVVDDLRSAIRRYNDAVGTPNTESSGYHETLTRYYVGAVAAAVRAGAVSAADVVGDPRCGRTAPLDHWSRRELFSVEARRDWVAPDLADLPWAGGARHPCDHLPP